MSDAGESHRVAWPRAAVWVERNVYSAWFIAMAVVVLAGGCALSMVHPLFVLLILLGPLVVYGWWATPRTDWAQVAVDAEGVRIEGEHGARWVSREALRGVWLGEVHMEPPRRGPDGALLPPRRAEAALVLRLRDGSHLRIAAPSELEAERAIAALGYDPRQRRARFQGRRVFHSLLVWLMVPQIAGAPVLIVTRWLPMAWREEAFWLAMAVLFLLLRWALRPALDVEVGADGLWIKTRLGARRVAWSSLDRVAYADGSLHLHFLDGKHRRVWCNPDDASVGPALARCADEGLRRFREGGGAGARLERLDRGGQSVSAWRAWLATLLQRTGGYRVEALDARELDAVLDNPSAPLARRVAAALALQGADPDAAPVRIRMVAERTADPEERLLFEAAAQGQLDDATLDRLSRKASG